MRTVPRYRNPTPTQVNELAIVLCRALVRTGHRVAWMDWRRGTLRSFVAAHPRGKFFLTTRGHALALIDGDLIDTTERGADERKVLTVLRIDGP
jgi:hypothetical protein